MLSVVSTLLTLLIGASVGAAALAIFRRKNPIDKSNLELIVAISQTISVIVALLTVVVSYNISNEQIRLTRGQYTRDRLDKIMTDEAKNFLKAAFLAGTDAKIFAYRGPALADMKKKAGGDVGNLRYLLPDGRLLKDAEIKGRIISATSQLQNGLPQIISVVRDVMACADSGLCDEEIASQQICNIAATLRFYNEEAKEGGSIAKLYSEIPETQEFEFTMFQQQLVDFDKILPKICPVLDIKNPNNSVKRNNILR